MNAAHKQDSNCFTLFCAPSRQIKKKSFILSRVRFVFATLTFIEASFYGETALKKYDTFTPSHNHQRQNNAAFLPTFRVVDRKTPTFPRFSHILPLLPFNFNLTLAPPLSKRVCVHIHPTYHHSYQPRQRKTKKSSPH